MIYTLQTEKFKGNNVKINTNIATLKEVWIILKEINLDGLLTGNNLDISITDMIDNLLTNNKLDHFFNTITLPNTHSVNDLDIQDVVGVFSLFFTYIAKPFQGLNFTPSNPTNNAL
jgi:hypothetical protein